MRTPTVDPIRGRAVRHGFLIAGIVFALFLWWTISFRVPNGGDSWAYWSVDAADPYAGARVSALLSYLYSPAFLQALGPLRALDWETFRSLWVAILLVAVVVQAGPWTIFVLAFPPVLIDLEVGNIHVLLALAIVLGFRWPATWAFVLLTKVTPGIGLVWFVVRREWRALAIALGVTVAIAAVSFAIAPGRWWEWVEAVADRPSVFGGAVQAPLLVRLPLAALLVAWGARHDRPYTVLLASMLALPDLWINGFAMLAGLPALLGLPGAPTFWRRGTALDRASTERLAAEPSADSTRSGVASA